jgi:hypothetical protein
MTFISVLTASKKIIKKLPIIIIDPNPNSILNNVKRMFSSSRDEIERDKSPSSNLSTFKEDISKKDRKINAVEINDESV